MRLVLATFVFLILMGVGAVSMYLGKIYYGDISPVVYYEPKLTTQVFDRYGKLLVNLYDKEHRIYVPYEEVPSRLIEALVAIEDTTFFEHRGINPEAIMRALYKVVLAGRAVEGASTITQQLVKNLLLTREKSLERKIKEAMLSLRIENTLTKEQILERYLNEIYFGHGYYGIRAAASGYFHKELDELSLKEIAILMGLPRAPSFYDPTKHKEMSNARANIVLERMYTLGWVNDDEYARALEEDPKVYDEYVSRNSAPYVIDYILRTTGEEFTDLKGGGYRIETTIDKRFQKAADEAVLIGYEQARKRIKKYLKVSDVPDNELNATVQKQLNQLNCAFVALEQQSGDVLALNGGVNYDKSPFNRVVQAKRLMGSGFKPFLYLSAFDLGYAPSSAVVDISRTYEYTKKRLEGSEEATWRPSNYERNFVGIMDAREAVVHSRNLASINLLDRLGLRSVRKQLQHYGFKRLPNNLSLALGTLAQTPIEVAGHLTLISNYGTRTKPRVVTRVVDRYGQKYHFEGRKTKVTEPKQAYLMIDVMKEVVKRGTGKRVKVKGLEIAAKTGTTNDNRDAWFISYTPTLQTIVWFGNDDNTPLGRYETGGRTAGPVAKAFYERKFDEPEGVIHMQVEGRDELFTDISKPPMGSSLPGSSQEEEVLF